MVIDLTDHLRCGADHEEAYLVLLPGTMERRRVVTGTLGCPVCGRTVTLRDGVADFGGGEPAAGATRIPPAAAAALLGIEGPGGFVALVGGATTLAAALLEALPGVRLALVNPPAGAVDSEAASVLRAGRLPLKRASMRAVAIAGPPAAAPSWLNAAIDAVLPGNRVVVDGPVLTRPDVSVLAEADGVWVGRAAGAGSPGY
jgi:hypothetical protein